MTLPSQARAKPLHLVLAAIGSGVGTVTATLANPSSCIRRAVTNTRLSIDPTNRL